MRVEVERETRLRVPLHHLGGIVGFGDVLISPALIGRCAENGIGMALLDRNGWFRARIEGPTSGNVLLRKAQFDASGNLPASLALARRIVQGKLKNARAVLQRGARDGKSDLDRSTLAAAVKKFDASLRSLAVADSADAVRGVEGEAARTYFAAFSCLIRPDLRDTFGLSGRNRRPPRDPINALLSFLYTLLTHDCRAALETVGLDPQVGFLHALRPGRPALALDLVEEFRAILADRVALALINRGQIKASDFRHTEGGGVLLEGDARRTVAIAWQEKKQETLRHPVLDADVPLGLLPQIQARLLARALRGDVAGYLPFVAR